MKDIGVTTAASPTPSAWARRARVQAVMERALKHFPLDEVSGHFHDTYGQALANIYACLEMGMHLRHQHRRPGRLPLCQGRHRQRGHRGRGVHAARHGHRPPASTSTRWSTPAATSAACWAARRSRAPARRCWRGAAPVAA
jgi:hypothetical protein